MRWQICEVDGDAVARLGRELNIPNIVARLLTLRGVTDPETAQRFLHPALDQLHDPFLLADMKTAVDRLRRALAQKEKILVYGDYDVDGTMSAIILLAALRSLGGEVEAYIPHRLNDGYGMRAAVLEAAVAKGIRVVVSVDTGIREHEALNRARELGLDCILTDHHLPDADGHLPPACAILNPQRADSGYPEKVLAGVGVAFKLVQALLGERLCGRLLQSYLKVVALGTIADVVPLLGENRVIAHFGLEAFRQPSQAGLQALLEVCRLQPCDISAGDLGFRLAPRLNAAGRMEDARDVIDLFTCSDLEKAREIAGRLDRFNRDRQRIEEGILREIVADMDGRPENRRAPLPGAGRRGVASGSDRDCGAARGGAVPPSDVGGKRGGWGWSRLGEIDTSLSPPRCTGLHAGAVSAFWRPCQGSGFRLAGGADRGTGSAFRAIRARVSEAGGSRANPARRCRGERARNRLDSLRSAADAGALRLRQSHPGPGELAICVSCRDLESSRRSI